MGSSTASAKQADVPECGDDPGLLDSSGHGEVMEADSLQHLLHDLGPGEAPDPLRIDLPCTVGPDGAPINTTDGDEGCIEDGVADVVDGDDERLQSVETVIGTELVSIIPRPEGPEVVDRRGERYVRSDHLERLSPILREIARGRVGVVAKASEVVGGDARALVDAAVVASPVACEMVQPGDGTGEVLIASTVAGGYALAGRVAAKLNEELSHGGLTMNARRVRQLSQAFGALAKSMASGVQALERVRSLRRTWEVKLSVRRPDVLSRQEEDRVASH